MPVVSMGAKAKRTTLAAAVGGAALALAAFMPSQTLAEGATKEITIKVTKLKALDAWDELSKGDAFARVTIDSTIAVSPVVEMKAKEIKPGWALSAKVTPGVHKVKLEIVDKDLSADDPIDINKVANKRDLDFTVDTSSCRIEGFSQTYKCGASINRAGKEPKKADVTFTVSVAK